MRVVLAKLGLFLVMAIPATGGSAQTVNFCTFQIPETIAHGSASFTNTFEFTVDAAGVPRDIRAIKTLFIDEVEVKSCISTWLFPEHPGKHLVATFRWEHAVGWTAQSVTGPGIKLIVGIKSKFPPK
jgi:hypothetical protein